MNNIEKLYKYFWLKSEEISIQAKQIIASHTTIIGENREKIIYSFLGDFLPSKYSIGTGQFMGIEFQKDYESKQTDILIWDSFDFPKIRFPGSSDLFFAESVKMVIEVKSHFNFIEFEDIQRKSRHLKTYVPNFHPSIKDEIWRLENKIARAVKGKTEMHLMASAPPIAMAALCYKGGENFTLSQIKNPNSIEDDLPDVILLLEAGRLIVKQYELFENGKVVGHLRIYNTGINSLIGFTGRL
jgi:hypothetical protein